MKSHAMGGLILLYHRIAGLDRDPQLLCVSPENFERQIQILRERMKIVSLAEIAADVAAGRSPDGKVAITFDDGYADNALVAALILRRYNAPATIFTTTGHTNTSNEFFWDDLDRIFLSPGDLPRLLRIWLPKKAYEIDLGEWKSYREAEAQSHRNWTMLDEAEPTSRHRAYRELCTLLHTSTVARRRDILEQLQAWSGVVSRDTRRMMSTDELRQLVGVGPFEIGGHTIDHPLLSAETVESQRSQIRDNKRTLECIVGRPMNAFSYPFGTRKDFTSETLSIVKAAGYQLACANFAGKVAWGADLFALPRMIVRDWSAEAFQQKLTQWLPMLASASISKAA
jgi:peptidoglycan/xylan/chitin deacetylase (PgdA/CDA1 family)